MGVLKNILRIGLATVATATLTTSSYRPYDDERQSIIPEPLFIDPIKPIPGDDSFEHYNFTLPNGLIHFDHALYGTKDPFYTISSPVTGIQFEGDNFYPFSILTNGELRYNFRHCQAAADIQENTAQLMARMDFDTLCVDSLLTTRALRSNQRDLLNSAAVAAMSYTLDPYRNDDGWRSTPIFLKSTLQYDQARENLRRFWQETEVITVQAAGNLALTDGRAIERQGEYVFSINDTHLTVGAAYLNNQGRVYVDYYSAAGSPSVVAYNPFEHDFEYDYYYSDDDVEHYIENRFTSRESFNALGQCRPSQTDIENQPLDVLQNDIKRCIGRDFNRSYDDDAPVKGTSQTTPHVAGMLLAAQGYIENRFGQNVLNSYDYFSAVLLAATPVRKARTTRINRDVSLQYSDNGAGLFYNDNYAGFGVVDYDEVLRTAIFMAQNQQQNPSRTTQQRSVTFNSADMGFLDITTNRRNTEYRFYVGDDDLLLNTQLRFSFKGGSQTVPERIELISPEGASITLSPSKESPDDTYSFASTTGFFGNSTQGIWTIKVDRNAPVLNNLDVHFVTTQTDGVIKSALDRRLNVTRNRLISARRGNSPALSFD